MRDDYVSRNLTASALNQVWLADITEHRTSEEKLYVCAVEDVFSNRIIGYWSGSRVKSRIAFDTRSPGVGTSPGASCTTSHPRRPFREGLSWIL